MSVRSPDNAIQLIGGIKLHHPSPPAVYPNEPFITDRYGAEFENRSAAAPSKMFFGKNLSMGGRHRRLEILKSGLRVLRKGPLGSRTPRRGLVSTAYN